LRPNKHTESGNKNQRTVGQRSQSTEREREREREREWSPLEN